MQAPGALLPCRHGLLLPRRRPRCPCRALRQVCDVSSLQDVRALAEEWKQSGRPLHVLVNNAGVMVSMRGAG